MDLSGGWRGCTADDEVRRNAVGLDFDDSAWPEISVPGHWRCEPGYLDEAGPVVYRRSFRLDAPKADQRVFITLHGVFYQADVWLDGAYLGDPEGYFFPHSFDVTSLARLADEHVLVVEVACAAHEIGRANRNITGVFQDRHSIDRHWNPGGLWQPVTVDTTGPVRIDRCRVLCRDANDARAHLRLGARLDSDLARSVKVTTIVDGVVAGEQQHSLAKGPNEIAWNFDIAKPRLWWPWSLGEQALTHVQIVVACDDVTSDERTVRTGLREVALHDWVFSVNGERMFTKGVNLLPAALDLASATADSIGRDVHLARDAGLDLVRLKGHISRPELYDVADELGMLVWQDFPLHGEHSRSIRRQAVEQAQAAVDVLGHHPSIAMWCAHDTPEENPVRQQLPTWNRTILDRWVKRAFENADESRPVVANSGMPAHLPKLDWTDSRLRLGWGRGDERDLPGMAAAVPNRVRFVSEFGAQSVPDTHGFIDARSWPDLDWEELVERNGLDRDNLVRYVPPAPHPTFESWAAATQQYQATLLRHHIETLRRLKYRPTGGFCLSSLADPAPMISTAILDHERKPKLAFASVTDACRPLIIVADRLPEAVPTGAGFALDVHAVSDLHRTLDGAECGATLRWPGGSHRWQWQGDVPPDGCVRVGTIQFVVPDAPGQLWLDLTLVHGDEVATNRYEATIER